MIERFLKQTHFTSEEDYREHLHFIVPDAESTSKCKITKRV